MGLMGMHSTFGQKPCDMTNTTTFFELGDDFFDRVGFGNQTGFDRVINFRQFLHHNPTGTQIHMADFRIAHLPFGQADIQTASL